MIGFEGSRAAGRILPAIAVIVMLGCSSVPSVHYYTLGDVTLESHAAADSTKPVLRVERLAVAQPYDGRRIVYRPAPNEVAFWDYRQWAEPPAKLITSRVAELLGQTGMFQAIDTFPYSWRETDLVLRGAVLAFEEVDRGADWYGRVKLFLELRAYDTGKTLWSSKIEVEEKSTERNPKAVVVALSSALSGAVSRAEKEMAGALR